MQPSSQYKGTASSLGFASSVALWRSALAEDHTRAGEIHEAPGDDTKIAAETRKANLTLDGLPDAVRAVVPTVARVREYRSWYGMPRGLPMPVLNAALAWIHARAETMHDTTPKGIMRADKWDTLAGICAAVGDPYDILAYITDQFNIWRRGERFRDTPLFARIAFVTSRNPDIVALLCEAGQVSVGETALLCAVAYACPAVIARLLDRIPCNIATVWCAAGTRGSVPVLKCIEDACRTRIDNWRPRGSFLAACLRGAVAASKMHVIDHVLDLVRQYNLPLDVVDVLRNFKFSGTTLTSTNALTLIAHGTRSPSSVISACCNHSADDVLSDVVAVYPPDMGTVVRCIRSFRAPSPRCMRVLLTAARDAGLTPTSELIRALYFSALSGSHIHNVARAAVAVDVGWPVRLGRMHPGGTMQYIVAGTDKPIEHYVAGIRDATPVHIFALAHETSRADIIDLCDAGATGSLAAALIDTHAREAKSALTSAVILDDPDAVARFATPEAATYVYTYTDVPRISRSTASALMRVSRTDAANALGRTDMCRRGWIVARELLPVDAYAEALHSRAVRDRVLAFRDIAADLRTARAGGHCAEVTAIVALMTAAQ